MGKWRRVSRDDLELINSPSETDVEELPRRCHVGLHAEAAHNDVLEFEALRRLHRGQYHRFINAADEILVLLVVRIGDPEVSDTRLGQASFRATPRSPSDEGSP